MAELNARIIAKASATAAEEPLAADLEVAELAVNTADGKLFTKHTDGSVVTISGGSGGGVTTLDDVGDVQYPTTQSFSGLTNSTGSTSSSSVANSGDWTIPAAVNSLVFHEDQSTEMSLLEVNDSVIFEAYGLTHTATVLTAAAVSSGVRWNIQVNPGFPSAWQGPTMPAGEVLTVTSSRFPSSVLDPADGKILTWVGANSQWETVNFDVAGLSDVDLAPPVAFEFTTIGETVAGGWNQSNGFFQFNDIDANGASTALSNWPGTSGTIWISTNGDDPVELYYYNWVNPGSFIQISYSTFDYPNGTFVRQGDCLIYLSDPASPDLAEGDILQWNNTDQKFKPTQLPAGGGATTLDALTDVNTESASPAFSADFEGPYPYATKAGDVSTDQAKTGTTSFKGTDSYGSLDFGTVLQSVTKRYDCWSFWAYNTNDLDSTYRLSLGGTLNSIATGSGYTIYTRDTGFGLYSDGTFSEAGTRPTITANQWHHFAVQVDFGSSVGLTRAPASVSIWVDGSIAVINETWPQAVDAYSTELDVLKYAWAASSSGTSHDKYYDDLRICQTDSPITSMTTSTIVEADYDAAVDAVQVDLLPLIGLVYSGNEWVPGWPKFYPPADGSLSYSVLQGTSYSSGSLEISGLDQIPFSSSDVPSGEEWKVYANSVYGAGVYAADNSGSSSFNVHPTKGAGVTATSGVCLRIEGESSATDNTPEVRFESGNGRASSPTGNYLGFKLPSSYSVDQTYTLPLVDGSSDEVLTTNGSGVLSWSNPSIQNMDDYALNTTTPTSFYFIGTSTASYPNPTGGNGDWYSNNTFDAWFADDDQNGVDFRTVASAKSSGDSVWISYDNVSWTQDTLSGVTDQFGCVKLSLTSVLWGNSYASGSLLNLYVSFSDPTQPVAIPLVEGDILQWSNADQKFNPAQLRTAAETRTLLGIGEYVDDSAAGTGGVASGAMYYNTTSSDYRLKS